MGLQGTPFWYELSTHAPEASRAFYGPLLGWQFQDAGMEGFDYTLARKDGAMVAGVMDPGASSPEFWMIYFAVSHCDDAVAKVKILGGQVHRAPEDIPGTGRYAIVADPQGAVFGLMQPLDDQPGAAFDQSRPGHGHWHDLHSTDPVAGWAFYAELLGWSEGDAMPMGEDGAYQMFTHAGGAIGGMMGMMGAAGVPPYWQPYFGSTDITAATAQITALGGTILHGPAEVPGGAWIVQAQDDRGAVFALVGPHSA